MWVYLVSTLQSAAATGVCVWVGVADTPQSFGVPNVNVKQINRGDW